MIKKWLYGDYITIPDKEKAIFLNLETLNSYTNTLRITKVMAIVTLLLLISDILTLSKEWTFGYQLLKYAHVVQLSGFMFLILLSKVAKLYDISKATNGHRFFVSFFSLFIMFIATSITLIDQYINPEMTVFAIGILTIAVVSYAKPKDMLMGILLNFIYLEVVMHIIQHNPTVLLKTNYNGPLVVIIGYLISYNINNMKVRSFLKNKRLKEMHDELVIANEGLSASSEELQQVNEELQASSQELQEANEKLSDSAEELQQVNEELQASSQELQEANERLYKLSYTDGLTNVANRRNFDDVLLRECNRSKRYEQPLSLIIIDIDYFKYFNDTYGHINGDDCLKLVASMIKECVKRPTDLAARYGGEEFAVILTNTDRDGAIVVADRLRIRIETSGIENIKSLVCKNLTISLGIASGILGEHDTPGYMIRLADKALYTAKEEGRNRLHVISLSDINK